MDGEQKTARELWARHLADEGITHDEEMQLREALLTNDEMRNEMLADDTMHRCLQALSIPLEDEDAFVSGVMIQIVEGQHSQQRAEPPQAPPVIPTQEIKPAVEPGHGIVPVIRCEPRRRQDSGWMTPRAVQPLVAVAALALFFLLGSAVGVVVSRRSPLTDRMPTEPPREDPVRSATSKRMAATPDSGVGTLVSTEFGTWDRPRVTGSRLQPGPFRLERGEAEIQLDSGARLRLIGPAEFELDSPSQLAIDRGTLAAVVPASAGEVKLRTPTSNVIGELATVELVVNRNGASDVLVHDGEVTVEPWANSVSAKPLVLTATDVNRATVWQPSNADPRSPLALASQGNGGKFSGRISVNGREMDFDSPEAFESVRQRCEQQFRDSIEQFERDWATAVQRFGGGAATGEVNFNGVRMGFENLDDVFQLQRKLAEAAAQQLPQGNAAEAGAFQGMININGEVREFSSREEFEKAQQEVFGPLQGVDLGGLKNGNLQEFFNAAPNANQPKGNPFLPRKKKPADDVKRPVKDDVLKWKEV